MDEGSIMHHCVGSYDNSIMSGDSYIYHVEAEIDGEVETDTLELNKSFEYTRSHPAEIAWEKIQKSNQWKINQFRSKCNGVPSNKLINILRRWYNSNQENIGNRITLIPEENKNE